MVTSTAVLRALSRPAPFTAETWYLYVVLGLRFVSLKDVEEMVSMCAPSR